MSGKYEKKLTSIDIILSTIGYIVGAGIFAVIGIAAKYGKDFTWLAMIICGLLAICTGMSYSELASMYEKNGGEYFYVKDAFGNNSGMAVSLVLMLTEIMAITAVAFGLSSYLTKIINIPVRLLTAGLLLTFAGINYSGIRSSINYNNFTTILEVGVLLGISILGCRKIPDKVFDLSKIDTKHVHSLIISVAVIFFAFIGFDVIIELSEETKNASRVIPYSMMIGIVISTLIYITVGLAAVSSIGWKTLSKSKAPLADVAKHLVGSKGYSVVYFIALLAMSNSILMGHVAASRFLQGVSKSMNLPDRFGFDKIDETTKTPINAIIFITACTLLALGAGNLENSVIFSNITTMILFTAVNLSAVILRFKKPDAERKFKIPFNINNIPIPSLIGATSSILLGIYLLVRPVS